MPPPPSNSLPAGQPSLQDLTARFLAARTAGAGDVESTYVVVPHQVAGGFRAPARVTWDETVMVCRLFGVEPEKLPQPPEWSAFATLAADGAVPLAAGFFPQRFRLTSQAQETENLTPQCTPQLPGFSTLRGWVRKVVRSDSATTLLVAAGVAACLGDVEEADAALAAADRVCFGTWRVVWQNQQAAIHWLRGEHGAAKRMWSNLADSPATAFNRGMATLISGRPEIEQLKVSAAAIPPTSGWAHLANLYVNIAETAEVSEKANNMKS